MDLKEFTLDLPYVSNGVEIKSIIKTNNCLENEATKLDYEANWKDKRRIFRLETRCISSMFERIFGKMKTEDCWKIIIECVEDITEQRVLNLLGVYYVQVKFDYDSFTLSDDYSKKQKTLNMLMEGIRIISNEKGWSNDHFEEVYLQIQNSNYLNEWVWKKPVKSPNKKFASEVLCRHGVKYMDIYLVLRDKKGGELDRKILISEVPDEFAYAKHLGELKWISNSEVALVSKKGENTLTIKFDFATELHSY